MRKLKAIIIASTLLNILASSCSKIHEINDFESDGCSLFPDSSLISNDDWCSCCVEHDIAYWQGSTEEQRLEADKNLRDCVIEKTGNSKLADIMYTGVRFGGSPYFYTWYRWGYGWSYDRKYQPLTEQEKSMVTRKLEAYFENKHVDICTD